MTESRDPHAPEVRTKANSGLAHSELARRNLRFGWALFLLFWLLFAGTVLVAVLYLQLD